MEIAEKFFLTVIVFLLYSSHINCNASEYITKTAILTPVADTYVYQFGTSASPCETELRVGCQKIGDAGDTNESVSEKNEGVSAGKITNTAGIVESDAADLSVRDVVSIIDHPASHSQEAGKTVRFQVRAAGTGPLSFQWKKDHIDIQGANSENHIINSVQKKDEGI